MRLVPLLLAFSLAGPGAAYAQALASLPPEMARLERGLRLRAAAVLEESGTTFLAVAGRLVKQKGREWVDTVGIYEPPARATAAWMADTLRRTLLHTDMSGYALAAGVLRDSIAGPVARAVDGAYGPAFPRRAIAVLEDQWGRCRRVERPYRFVDRPNPGPGLGRVEFGAARVTECRRPGYWLPAEIVLPPGPGPLRLSRPIELSSLGSWFGMQGRLAGTLTVRERQVTLDFREMQVRYRGSRGQPTRLDSITVSVAAGDSAWSPMETSRGLRIMASLQPGGTLKPPPARFVIAHWPGMDEACQWLVVTFHMTPPDAPRGFKGSWASAYASSERGILVPPGSPRCRLRPVAH